MKLVEQHRISKSHKYFKDIDALCFLAKNLYNKANYDIRQEFIKTSKEKEQGLIDHANWIRYNQIQKNLQNDKQIDYNSLPAKVSQQILMGLDQTWKSFFNSIKDFKKTPAKYLGKPSLPKYKHKTKGRYVLTYTIQAISSKLLKKGLVRLSGTDIIIETRKTNIQQVRVVPKNQEYIIEIVYDQEIKINENLNKDLIAGIDIGLNNLASVTSNKIGLRPILINGRPLKSINQFYNKKLAEAHSFIGARGTSNRCCRLTNKRNRKTNNYLHNASRYVVNWLIENNIGNLVIGKNDGWKQDINLGSKTNQKFVSIPHAKFIQLLLYKCELVGITAICHEESYTSKCSFLDMEPMEHRDSYMGKRIKRGMFKTSKGQLINADVNGSLNIIRKVFPVAFGKGIEGLVVSPASVTACKTKQQKKFL